MKPFPKSEQNETVFKTVIILKVLKRLFNIFVDFGDVKAVCCRDSLFIKRSKNIFKTFLFFCFKSFSQHAVFYLNLVYSNNSSSI